MRSAKFRNGTRKNKRPKKSFDWYVDAYGATGVAKWKRFAMGKGKYEPEYLVLEAECSTCGYIEEYQMSEEEAATHILYYERGREMGYLQNLFPKIPAWIRSGAIDQYSGGFCICPKCCG